MNKDLALLLVLLVCCVMFGLALLPLAVGANAAMFGLFPLYGQIANGLLFGIMVGLLFWTVI